MANADGVSDRARTQHAAERCAAGETAPGARRNGIAHDRDGREPHLGQAAREPRRRFPSSPDVAALRLARHAVPIVFRLSMSPDQYCQDKAAQSGSSFYYSFLFLPPERRRAITALYAYCREVDDVVDECSDADLAKAKLAWWRQEVAQLFAGIPQHPVTRALASAIGPFGITQARLNEIMDGMEMDLNQSRYLDFAALQLYCHRVAGVVGALAAAIFGYGNPRT